MVSPDKVFSDPQAVKAAAAAMHGDATQLEGLLRGGAVARAVGREGFTLPHFALLAPRPAAPGVLRTVLRYGGDPVSVLTNGQTVPQIAVSRDNADPEVVKVLLESGIGANWMPPREPYKDQSLLQSAVMGRNLPVVRLLVERGANLNYVNPFRGSALHYALDGSDFFIPAYLVEAGIDLNIRNNTSPEIDNPRLQKRTALEEYCHSHSGKRPGQPLPRIAEGWRAFVGALANRGVTMPCGL